MDLVELILAGADVWLLKDENVHGNGRGNGIGYGDWTGSGTGNGYGNGRGYGDGFGYGIGYGNGPGYGSGTGNGDDFVGAREEYGWVPRGLKTTKPFASMLGAGRGRT